MKKTSLFNRLPDKPVFEYFASLKTPCYVIDEERLKENGRILLSVMEHTGCRFLLAQKAFSNFDFYPLLSQYLTGTEASGLYEARLGAEEMPDREVHTFCAAYRDDEFEELLRYADHIVFNSINQLKKFGPKAKEHGKSIGIRINPERSTQEGHKIYDPCAKGSRLGVTRDVWDREMTKDIFSLLEGLHFHTLCEQDSDALEITLQAVEQNFGDVLPYMKWLNMGGGHHITKKGYNLQRLENIIVYAQKKWDLCVYLEPGEAVALNAGYLICRVLDVVENGDIKIAILDASAACHMPDVIEMPYTPPLLNEDRTNEGKYSYRLAGPTCLSGDIIGEYSFKKQLQIGDLIVFGDMAIYTTCKNNTFNGMPLPNIYRMRANGTFTQLTDFGYQDFKSRLGNYRKKGDR